MKIAIDLIYIYIGCHKPNNNKTLRYKEYFKIPINMICDHIGFNKNNNDNNIVV